MNDSTELRERPQAGGLVSVEQERALGEVQAQVIMAKRFPRDEDAARDAILKACTRKTLADAAMYAYPRGGTEITGPSIRLAECIAQKWRNLDFGVREISRSANESVCEAYAWDLETNSRQRKIFTVPHVRWARGRAEKLNDPRDIYETIANMGARRLRACILGIIPGDVVEEAVEQCDITQRQHDGDPKEAAEKMAKAFEKFDVTREMLEKRLGHNLEATISPELAPMRRIFNSLRDGMSKVGDWFGSNEPDTPETDDLTAELRSGAKAKTGPADRFYREKEATGANAETKTGDTGDQGQQSPASAEASAGGKDPAGAGQGDEWPKWVAATKKWYDANGEEFDNEAHGWNAKAKCPAVRQDGAFKARRGTGGKPATPSPEREQQAGATQQAAGPDANTIMQYIHAAADADDLAVCEDSLRGLNENERYVAEQALKRRREALSTQ